MNGHIKQINKLEDDWTFNGASTRDFTHCYHDYPARMIPQVVRKLLELFGQDAKILFDPYCGSGTSLVEANIRGIDAIGTDLNPLARLIAKTKTSTPDVRIVENLVLKFEKNALKDRMLRVKDEPEIYGIPRLNFWFKESVAKKLFEIRNFIDSMEPEEIKLFFQVAFSETVRESSNTRNDEFKLYRYDEETLSKFNPDVYQIMVSKLRRNLVGLKQFTEIICKLEKKPKALICDFDTVDGIPKEFKEKIDIVITSPPYGDSRTTVAYGQYSRLSSAWLGLKEPHKVDNRLMGGKKLNEISDFPSKALLDALSKIKEKDEKRALEVASFYNDLFKSIKNVSKGLKSKAFACYVVGNRKVKGVVLPTDKVIIDFFAFCGFEHHSSFVRSIPKKRMPKRNSPTNIKGKIDETMTKEHIVVIRKR